MACGDRVGGQHAGDGEPPTEGLADGDDVGAHAGVVDPPAQSGATEAGDHLVGDEKRADVIRDGANGGQELLGRDDVPRGSLHGLDDERRHGSRGRGLDVRTDEIGASQAAARVGGVQGTAVAVGVGNLVRAGNHGPEAMLEGGAHERERTHGLAVKSAPETHEFVLARVRFRQAQGTLDGFRAARVELQAMHPRGRRLSRQSFHQFHARRRGEGAHRGSGRLRLYIGHEAGVGMAQGIDGDAADEVQEGVPIHIGHRATPGLLHHDPGHHGVALQSRRHVRVLAPAQCLALRTRHGGRELRALVFGLRGIDGGLHAGFSLVASPWTRTHPRRTRSLRAPLTVGAATNSPCWRAHWRRQKIAPSGKALVSRRGERNLLVQDQLGQGQLPRSLLRRRIGGLDELNA